MVLINIDRSLINKNYSRVSLKEDFSCKPTPEEKTRPTAGENEKDFKEAVNEYLQRFIKERQEERLKEQELGKEGNYIEPELMIRKIKDEKELHRPGKKPGPEGQYEYERIKPIDLISKKVARYVIVADSGMGKTTLLKELALRVAEKQFKVDFVPIYIHLKELEDCFDIPAFKDRLATRTGIPIAHIDELYGKGKFLFLMDGLDQVFKWDNFRYIFRDDFIGKNLLITAGRPYAYSMNQSYFGKYGYVAINNFDRIRIEKYLGEDYQREHLKSFVNHNHFIAGIPIILRLMKDIVRKGEFPYPATRTVLYGKIIEELLAVAVELSKLQMPVNEIPNKQTIQKRFSILSYFTLKQGEIGRFSRERVFPDFCRALELSPEKFEYLTRMGIIYDLFETGKNSGEIIFRHQSFQEYLAALELKEKLFIGDHLDLNVLEEHLEHRYWDETIIFTVGLLEGKNARPLINKIKEYDLALAGLCLDEYKGNRSDFERLIDSLFEKIMDENINIRKALIRIADENIIEKLIGFLRNIDEAVRWSAAYVLGEIGPEKAVEPLVSLLKDEDRDVRLSAANALGEIGSERALEPLIALFKDEDEFVRESAAYSLGKIGSEKALELLIALLKDEDEDVRWSAADALGKIGQNLNREGQDQLVVRIRSLPLDDLKKKEVIEEMKQSTGRRFIRILKSEIANKG